MRAQKYLVLPEEDAAEFAGLEAASIEELAPTGALQTVLARRVAVAAWRLARADRLEVEVFEAHQVPPCELGLALLGRGVGEPGLNPVPAAKGRDGTRSFETLLRYRGAAMAEFCRGLRTLEALQAEQAAATGPALEEHSLAAHPARPARPPLVRHPRPNEPAGVPGPRLHDAPSEPPASGRTLHAPAAPWLPNEPGTGPGPHAASPRGGPMPDEAPSKLEPARRARKPPASSACRKPNEPDRVRVPDQLDPHDPTDANPTCPRSRKSETRAPLAPAPSASGRTDSHGRTDPLNKCRIHG